MEKLYITEEIANHTVNKDKSLEVGEFEVSFGDTCGGVLMPAPPHQGALGHYSCVLGNWVWVPAP